MATTTASVAATVVVPKLSEEEKLKEYSKGLYDYTLKLLNDMEIDGSRTRKVPTAPKPSQSASKPSAGPTLQRTSSDGAVSKTIAKDLKASD